MGLQTPYTQKEVDAIATSCPIQVGDRVLVQTSAGETEGQVTHISLSVVTRGNARLTVAFSPKFGGIFNLSDLRKIETAKE